MKIEDFLSRLQKVRKTGLNNWIACCPAHGDKNPSMTVSTGDNGGIIFHCFTLCSFEDVIGALGLEAHELMPDKPVGREFVRGRSKPFPAGDVLECIADEVMIAWVISRDMELARPVKQADFDRLTMANTRIQAALSVARGR